MAFYLYGKERIGNSVDEALASMPDDEAELVALEFLMLWYKKKEDLAYLIATNEVQDSAYYVRKGLELMKEANSDARNKPMELGYVTWCNDSKAPAKKTASRRRS